MNDHVESFHFRRCANGEIDRLLQKIGGHGVVYHETNGWVTFLPLGESSSLVAAVSANCKGVVLHYLYDEDNAWMVNLFSNGKLKSSYVSVWSPEYYVKDDLLDITAFYPYLMTQEAQTEFRMIFTLDEFEDIFEVNPAFRFAQLLGIEHYQWLPLQRYKEKAITGMNRVQQGFRLA
ncbi:MAG: hypothetical protein OEZ68_02830 [Gammaproteobacteria bacterium]|nr:hypothetical protein [Gammaproteobacteria bacterium]MDH5799716.1 hypothetical protein [Gammaproteobacteria bacterium]